MNVTRTADCGLRRVLFGAMLLALLPPCRLAAQQDPRLISAVRLAQEGQGDSARAIVKRVLDATPAAQPLYAEAVFTSGVVASSTAEMERQYQRLVVEFNGSAWSDDAILKLMQLNFARGDLVAVARGAERLHGDYPQSEVIPEAALWASRAYFRQQNTADGCRWLADGLARADTLDVELRNSLVFLNSRCPAAQTAPDTTAPKPAPVDTTRPVRPDDCTHGCWGIQVASSSTTALANDAVAKLGREGFPDAYVRRDGAAFKVRLGRFPARAGADELLVRVRAKYPSAFVIQDSE